jgi:hypothetical protein
MSGCDGGLGGTPGALPCGADPVPAVFLCPGEGGVGLLDAFVDGDVRVVEGYAEAAGEAFHRTEGFGFYPLPEAPGNPAMVSFPRGVSI